MVEGRVGEAGAVFGFASWLTTLSEPITMSARHDAAKVAELAGDYCRSQGWEVNDDFHEHLNTAPEAQIAVEAAKVDE